MAVGIIGKMGHNIQQAIGEKGDGGIILHITILDGGSDSAPMPSGRGAIERRVSKHDPVTP